MDEAASRCAWRLISKPEAIDELGPPHHPAEDRRAALKKESDPLFSRSPREGGQGLEELEEAVRPS